MPSLKDIMELRKNERLYCDFMIQVVSSVVGKHNWNHRVNTKVKKLDELATATDEACALLLLENSYDRWVDIFKKNNYQVPTRRHGVKSNTERVESNVPTRYTSGGHFYYKEDGDVARAKQTISLEQDDDLIGGNTTRSRKKGKERKGTRSSKKTKMEEEAAEEILKSANSIPTGNNGGGELKQARKVKGWSSRGVRRFNELFKLVKQDRSLPANHGFFGKLMIAAKPRAVRRIQKRAAEDMWPTEVVQDPFSDDDDDSKQPFATISPASAKKQKTGVSDNEDDSSEGSDDEGSVDSLARDLDLK